MRKVFTRKLVAAGGATAALIVGSTVAFAFFSGAGTVVGHATVGSPAAGAVTVTQTDLTAGQLLVPGGTPIPLAGTLTNPGTASVGITSLTAAVTAVTGTGSGTCAAADFVIGGNATFTSPIPAGASEAWTGLTVAMNDTNANQDACKGATLDITYTAA